MRLNSNSQVSSAPLEQVRVVDLLQGRPQQAGGLFAHIRRNAEDQRRETMRAAFSLQVFVLERYHKNVLQQRINFCAVRPCHQSGRHNRVIALPR